MIAHALDGELQQLADHKKLTWVPAHTTLASVGEVKCSDGSRLSLVEWRANRLADGLAKQAAAFHEPPDAVLRLLNSATQAAKHATKLLGRVTHAANNHTVQAVGDDGQVVSRTVRDSIDAPKRQKAHTIKSQSGLKPVEIARPCREFVPPWTTSSN